MFLSSITVRSIFLCVILLVFVTVGEAGWLQKLIYNEKRFARFTDSHLSRPLNATGIGTVFDSSDSVLQHNDGKGHNMIRPETILNIDGNPDSENNTPLHQISPDTDKETLYRENALLKQKIVDAAKRLPNEEVAENHPAIDVSADNNNDDAPISTLTDEPSVFIKGAKMITTGDSSDTTDSKNEASEKTGAIHINLPPAHIYKPTIINQGLSAPPFLQELNNPTKYSEAEPHHTISEEHSDGNLKPEKENVPSHGEKGNMLVHNENNDEHLKNELEDDALNNAFLPSLLTHSNQLPAAHGLSNKLSDDERLHELNTEMQPVEPLREHTKDDHSGQRNHALVKTGFHQKHESDETGLQLRKPSYETASQQSHSSTEDIKAAKQTLYDLTKSLVKNGNIGNAMVYIPRGASASSENQEIGTHVSLYPNEKDYNSIPFSNQATDRNNGLDNSHIVNEINEELKNMYGQPNNENELNKPVQNIGLNTYQNVNYGFNTGQNNQEMRLPYTSNAVGQLPYQQLSESPYNNIKTNNYDTGFTVPNALQQQTISYAPSPQSPATYMIQPQNYYQQTPYAPPAPPNNHDVGTLQQTPSSSLSLLNNSTGHYNKIRILCIGDSLTSGYYGDRHVYHPFSIQLSKLLNTNIADEFELITRGIGGEKVHQMYARLQKLLVTEKPLDLVIILGGLNDLIKLDISVDIFKEVISLHELCHSFGISTVSMTIPETHMPLSRQVYANYDQFLVVWGSLNEKIRNYSSNWTIPCDLARKFPLASLTEAEKRAWWSKDFIHPTMEGYNQIGRIVYGCIVSIL